MILGVVQEKGRILSPMPILRLQFQAQGSDEVPERVTVIGTETNLEPASPFAADCSDDLDPIKPL